MLNSNKGSETQIRELARIIWNTIGNLKCIMAISFIIQKNSKNLTVNYPLSFWIKRQIKLEKFLSGIAFNPNRKEIEPNIFMFGEEQKMIAFFLTPAVILVIIYNGHNSAEVINQFVSIIKTVVSHIFFTIGKNG